MFLAKMILKEILKDILSISFISVDYIKKKIYDFNYEYTSHIYTLKSKLLHFACFS